MTQSSLEEIFMQENESIKNENGPARFEAKSEEKAFLRSGIGVVGTEERLIEKQPSPSLAAYRHGEDRLLGSHELKDEGSDANFLSV